MDIFAILVPVLASGLVWLWTKYGKLLKQIKVVGTILESIADNELSKEEATKIIEEIRSLLVKKDS